MDIVKKLFKAIGKDNIDENSTNILDNRLIDSLDIIALMTEIEKEYGKTLDSNYLEAKNFQDFKSIKKMLDEAFKK